MSVIKTSLAVAALIAMAAPAPAQVPVSTATTSTPSLAVARTLYASAEYGGALDMLNGLLAQNPAAAERQSIDLYRTLCLVAVGNASEATRIIDAMITQDPLYRPASDDVPPRLRTAFADARRRLLPNIVQQAYMSAKSAFDKKDYAAASKGFTQVLAGLNDPDIEAATGQPPLSDLKVLAMGFQDLAAKAIAPPPPPPPAPAPAPVAEKAPRIYVASDSEVVPPITIRQVVPAYPGRVLVASAGMMEIVIDETGTVESATMESSLNSSFDRMALAAAKTWQYQPATVDGKPVKFRKRIQLSLQPPAPAR